MSYRLFISHAWQYHDAYTSIVSLLDDAPYFSYTNYSVPVDKKFERMSRHELEEEIKQQIRPVNCFIALAGVYASYSDWIQFELDFASEILDKPIIGIRPRGNINTSTAITRVAKEVVGWNTSSIIDAIRKYSI